MEISETLMDRMDSYLEGNMSDTETKAFEMELDSNPELASALAKHRETILTIQSVGLQKDLAKVMERNREREKQKSKTISINRNLIAIAASVVLLLGAFFFLRPAATTPGLALYEELYQKDPGLPTLMGATDNPIFMDAMVSYKEGDYKKALESLDVLKIANPQNDTLAFYQGLCHLELDQPQKSIQAFEQIDPAKPVWGVKAEWYRALALLKNNQLDQAKVILQKIANAKDHRYQREATQALEKLP
ncbi:MAG: hypothetical protein KDC53_13405 [Saprospiraceae bacterium]|nr:hypothetical protein [Saprospiraceae bacterium]